MTAHITTPAKRGSPILRLVFGILGMFAFLTVSIVIIIWIGFGIFSSQALDAIRADPAVLDAVGEVNEISLDFSATMGAPGPEDFAYRVDGELADGLLVGRFVTVDADREELRDGTLTLDDGRTVVIGSVQRLPADPRRAESSDPNDAY